MSEATGTLGISLKSGLCGSMSTISGLLIRQEAVHFWVKVSCTLLCHLTFENTVNKILHPQLLKQCLAGTSKGGWNKKGKSILKVIMYSTLTSGVTWANPILRQSHPVSQHIKECMSETFYSCSHNQESWNFYIWSYVISQMPLKDKLILHQHQEAYICDIYSMAQGFWL